MKVFWWQGGVHIEPDSEEDFKALKALEQILRFTPGHLAHLDHRVLDVESGAVETGHKQSVTAP